MHDVVDLRSDTITRPTSEMRRIMAEAEVGDDVYEDDPTINRLQQIAAELTGKEAALLVPSGTMGNAVAIKVHTHPGDEILLDTEAHSMLYEVGLPATLAQVLTRQFHSVNGIPDLDEIDRSIHAESLHGAGTTLLVLENTHNRAGGYVIPLEVHRQLWSLAHERGLRLHLDGARIFNASIATGIPVKEFAVCTDSITFCLSKGLGCPVGSVLCGSHEFITRARRIRKMLGGGMRQAGILAAAGIYALQHHVKRLADDHMRARTLAQRIQDVPGITLETLEPPTNMVYFQTEAHADRFAEHLAKRHKVRCGVISPHRIRLVTHLDVDSEDIDYAAEAIRATSAQLTSYQLTS